MCVCVDGNGGRAPSKATSCFTWCQLRSASPPSSAWAPPNLLMRSAPLRWGERRPHPTCSRVLHSLDGNNVAIAGALPTARRPPARPASS
jgi:hypothetical protein